MIRVKMIIKFNQINALKVSLFLWAMLTASLAKASYGSFDPMQTPAEDSLRYAVEGQILIMNYDSAKALHSGLNQSAAYTQVLAAMINNQANYHQQRAYIESVIKRPGTEALEIDRFLSENLETPRRFDLDYVWIKWWQIENVGNRLLDVQLAAKLHSELRSYLSQYSEDTDDFRRAEILKDVHTMLFLTIERKGQELYDLALKVEERAKALADTTLITMAYKGKCNGIFYVRGIDEYIKIAKEAIELDYVRAPARRSPYYTEIILMLTSAMIYKRGQEEQVYDYIERLYEDPLSRSTSYITYLQLLQKLGPEHEIRYKIYDKFGVTNSPELIAFFEKDIEKTAHVIVKSRIAKESAVVLIRDDEGERAIKKIFAAIQFSQQAYSTDLSKALATYESDLVREQKDKELAIERLQNRNTLIIAGIGFLLFIVVVIALRGQRKSNRALSQKNSLIQEQNEKNELLLKEIHHRVKNNLQVVSSLLDLQSRGIEDEEALSTFMEGQNRVKAMALIHQKLYQNENLATIDFAEYAENLMKELATIYPSAKGVKTNIQADGNSAFDIDTAVPLGLILNELISNAYKYAFDGKSVGELNVSVEPLGDGQHQLTVSDSGEGLPAGFDFQKAKSLGLRLVRRLAKQLYGSVTYSHEEGAKFIITFTDTLQRKAI